MKIIKSNGERLEGSLNKIIEENQNRNDFKLLNDEDLFLLINTNYIGGDPKIFFGYYRSSIEEEKNSWPNTLYYSKVTPENKDTILEVSRGFKLKSYLLFLIFF